MDSNLQARLDFVKLDAAARGRLRGLLPLIESQLPRALDGFYDQVKAFPEARRFFGDDGHMDRAHGAQVNHWRTIAAADYDQRYVDAVLAVGTTHARIGLEPRWYIGGYALVADGLIRAIVARSQAPRGLLQGRSAHGMGLADDLSALIKAMLLDMDYAISVYLDAAEHARKEAERTAIERERALVTTAFGAALERLAAGDVTYRMSEALPPEYEQLRANFNAAAAQLSDTVGRMADASQAVQSGAGELSMAADDLSRRTEQQAAALEQAAAALDEITATVRATADSATHAHELVATARSNAQTGGEVVGEAVAAMSQIDTSSREITQIISVIDEIAFQTNLLALNAGVEAARAGDAGRGFAVVASEVRALAQRSAEAAKEIKALILASSEQVGAGVRLVGRTGEALGAVAEQITLIDSVVREITSAAREQASGLSQVNIAVNQMDQMTQQNAAMVEETTAAGHALRHEAETLNDIVARFTVEPQRQASSAPAAIRMARRAGARG